MINQLVQMHENSILNLELDDCHEGVMCFYNINLLYQINLKMGQIVVIQYAKLPNVNVLDSCCSSCFPLLLHSVL